MCFDDRLQVTPSLVQLRQWAAQGDEAAMAQLLNQALEHKQIEVEVWLDGVDLHLYLQGETPPDEKIAVMLSCRELEQWPQEGIETLWISGQDRQTQNAAWCWQLNWTGTVEQMPTVPQAARGELWRRPQVSHGIANDGDAGVTLWVPQLIDRRGWTAIATGIGLALVVVASPPVTFLLSPLITLVHELGHTVTNWLFGYPAIPAFDFVHGGGITWHSQRQPVLMGLVYGGLGFLFYVYWQNYLTARVLLGVAIAYSISAFTGIHTFLMVSMGHGFELMFTGICLGRALSGYGCRYAIERPLYAMVGTYVTIYDMKFSWQLIFDATRRAVYEQGKGGLLAHDLVRIAQDMWHVDLSVTASVMFWVTLFTPIVTGGIYRYWPWAMGGIHRLFHIKIARN